MNRSILCACGVIVLALLAGGAAAEGNKPDRDLASRIVEMTGARTKIVWQHQATVEPGSGWDATTPQYELMGFDTDEGKARVILPGPASYANCCIAPDGNQVLFTDMTTNTIYAVNWDGTNKREFTKGYVLCTWKNPKDKTHWLYFTQGGYAKGHLMRCRIDDPDVREVLWTKEQACHTLTVSADGTHAGSEFPWPNAGVAILPDVSWKQYGNGCNGCMAPDNSYRYFHMGGTTGHQGVMMYDAGGANKREVWFKNILGMERGHSWIPRWSTDVRFLTVNCPIGGNEAEVYLGQFDEEFTKVVRWIKITNQPGQDTKAYCWIDPGLGYHTGEVPLTVDIPAPGEGQWEWDFGDGEKANALAGKRTYEKPGEYRITARQGDTIVKGSARAFPAKPPAAAHVRFYDETNLAVVFDERVQLKDANISLASGTPVKSWTLDGDGINLTLELGGRIADNDALLLKGVYDRAQVPNALSDEPLPLKRPAWPTDRTDLAFLWESANKPSFQYNANAKEFTDTKLNNKERATYGPFGEMSLEGGILLAVDGGGGIYAKATKANQLTIQALITPANAYQGWGEKPRSIINCGGGGPPSSGNFRLAQERSKLVFYLRQRSPDRPAVERIELCNITDQAANHVIVSYQPGDLVCYLNGKQVLKTDKVNGTLNWGRPSFESGLNFGGSQVWEDDANPGWTVHGIGPSYPVWRGKVEGIALYARAIGPEEATANFQAYNAIIKARPVAPRITVRGKLAAKSVVPKASEIAPYRDALVVYEYDVEKVLKGKYDRKKIRVARWGLINARPAPLSRAKLGDTAELLIEPRENHPQLDAEVTRDTLDENFDLPIYVDVGNGPTGKPRLGSIRITPYEVWVPPGEKQQYTTIVLDQYRVPIDAPLQWSVTPGGSVNTGAFYGGARHIEHQKKGSGTVDQNGLFVSDGTIGTVTITAAGKDDPSVKGNARIAVDNYPSIAPWGNQLAIGAQLGGNGGITGDIDRVRVYNRALTDEEILASSKGKLTGKSLVADWAFDTLKDGTFANTAGQGLTAKILGEVEHVKEDGRAFIRLTSKWGCVLVNCDPRLDMSHSATFELWVRPTKPEQGTLLYKATPGTPIGFQVRLADGLASSGMHGWLQKGHRFSENTWAHLVVVYDVNGVRKHFIDGKLVGEHKPKVRILIK